MQVTGSETPGCRHSESGVSPVIGVMLMIIVTIIIAAVVSAFAGGMGTSAQPAPNAAFDIQIYQNMKSITTGGTGYPAITLVLRNGETMATGDLKIISSHYVNGQRVTFVYDPGSNLTQRSWDSEGAYGNHGGLVTFTTLGKSLSFGYPDTYWHQGDQFTGPPCAVLGLGVNSGGATSNPAMSNLICMSSGYYPRTGDMYHIEIVYKPTNSVLYSQDVTTE